jgi:hypothetical protein
MIYPVTLDLTILKNSTFKKNFVALASGMEVLFDGEMNMVNSNGHQLVAGDKIAFASTSGVLPCGLNANTSYYVLSTGLGEDQFKVSDSLGGAAIDFTTHTGIAESVYYAGKILDLTGYTLDADIRGSDESLATSFTCTLTSPTDGKFALTLTEAQTGALTAGSYLWDLKISSGTESYFWAKGEVAIESTVSRASG